MDNAGHTKMRTKKHRVSWRRKNVQKRTKAYKQRLQCKSILSKPYPKGIKLKYTCEEGGGINELGNLLLQLAFKF